MDLILSDELRRYVDERADDLRCTSADYVRSLIEQDLEQRRAAWTELLAPRIAELDAGLGVELDMARIIAEGRARRAAEKARAA